MFYINSPNLQHIEKCFILKFLVYGIGGETFGWNILIPKTSFAIQMKLAQQNQQLARIANQNAELEMKKFQREIKNKKYM